MTNHTENPAIEALQTDTGIQWRSLISVVRQHIEVTNLTHHFERIEAKKGVSTKNKVEVQVLEAFWSVTLSPKGVASYSNYITGNMVDAIALQFGVAKRLSDNLPIQTLCIIAMAGAYPPDGEIKHEVIWNVMENFPDGKCGIPRFYNAELAAKIIWRAREIVAYNNLIEDIDLPW